MLLVKGMQMVICTLSSARDKYTLPEKKIIEWMCQLPILPRGKQLSPLLTTLVTSWISI